MTEKQKYLLKLFKEVDEICKENNLRYVMSGGSLMKVLSRGMMTWICICRVLTGRSSWRSAKHSYLRTVRSSVQR